MPAESPPNLERLPPARSRRRLLLRRRVPLARAVPPLAAAAASPSLPPSLRSIFFNGLWARVRPARDSARRARLSAWPSRLVRRSWRRRRRLRHFRDHREAKEGRKGQQRAVKQKAVLGEKERGCGDRLSQRGPPRSANSVRGCGSDSAKKSSREVVPSE